MKILQISDTHLFDNPSDSLLGVNTQKNFEAMIKLIEIEESEEKADLILLSGDLSQDGSPNAYKRIADELSFFQIPIYFVPGNHDDSQIMAQVYPRKHVLDNKQLIFPHWQFILLDSQKKGAVEGYLSTAELDFMQRCLTDYPNHHAIIVFHHHPLLIGSAWLDKLGVINAEEFWRVAANYSNIHTVLFGHIHQEFKTIHQNVNCMAAPSTCIQFKPKQDDFGLDNIPPGYRWIKLDDHGGIQTGVRRWGDYIGEFMIDAKGY